MGRMIGSLKLPCCTWGFADAGGYVPSEILRGLVVLVWVSLRLGAYALVAEQDGGGLPGWAAFTIRCQRPQTLSGGRGVLRGGIAVRPARF